MLSKTIKNISEEFTKEAKSSPRLMADMAAMEKYMAESYSDRIIIELLQNSDDAQATKVKLMVVNNCVIFANDGRPFDDRDVLSICRSGASNKTKDKHIGHRGIGFKSTTAMSHNIIIFSDNNCFTFSKNKCAQLLGVAESDVPTVRVPFNVEKADLPIEILKNIEELSQQGYKTSFVFLDSKNSIIEQEIKLFDKSCLLFLRNIKEIAFRSNGNEKFIVERIKDDQGESVSIIGSNELQKWWIPVNCDRMFAFKMDSNNDIIECDQSEAVFHNFMPTIEKTPFKFKINAAFTTDPSRKNITLDDETTQILNLLADKLFDLINDCCQNKIIFKELIKLFITRVAYNQTAIFLYNALFSKLKKHLMLTLNNGTKQIVFQYKILDDSFDNSEKALIRKYFKPLYMESCINASIAFEELVSRLSDVRVDENIYNECLQNEDFVNKIPSMLYNNILAHIIKRGKTSSMISKAPAKLGKILIKQDDSIVSFEKADIRTNAIQTLKNSISSDELKWLVDNSGIDKKLAISSSAKIEVSNISAGTFISKWRSAEQQVVDIENMNGNKAEYVGNQNLGYDVLSKTTGGDVRYIEVKLLSSDKGEFTLTNNEYSSAHQYGDNYFLCLLVQKESEIKATYIQNPLGTLQLEKRVKQWEWYCDNFTGEVKIYKYRG